MSPNLPEEKAAAFLAPKEGSIEVDATVATTVQALDFGVNSDGMFLTLVCDDGAGNIKPFCITHGSTATITNPNPTAASGGGQTWAEFGQYNRILDATTRYAEIYPFATGFVRWYLSSPK